MLLRSCAFAIALSGSVTVGLSACRAAPRSLPEGAHASPLKAGAAYEPGAAAPVGRSPVRDARPTLPDVPRAGTIDVHLNADGGAANDTVVSLGVPFPQGVLEDDKALALKDAGGAPVAITTSVLARWPSDGSIRSVLVAFKATLARGAKATWKLAYGGAPGPTVDRLRPNPDGPVAAVLPAEWYAKSRVSGVLLPVAANQRFRSYDTQLAKAFTKIEFSKYDARCSGSKGSRTYYDGPHARYQWFLRSGEVADYRSARAEAVWYRKNEVTFYEGRQMAVHACQPAGWTPLVPMQWHVLRRMASQGNLDDYLVTGDPAAREVVLAFGEAYRRNLPALNAGSAPSIEATERNFGWTLMGLASYYALDPREEVKAALVGLVDLAVSWQKRGSSGAFEHDIQRADPSECKNGPSGASPFMTSLLVDGLMDYWLLTGDSARVEPVVRKVAEWYATKAITPNKTAFRYLWNCVDNPYDDSSPELNLLIGHVFGAAYVLTKDSKWLDFGDRMADSGMRSFYAGTPKHWNQVARSFGRYLGYRALGKAP